MKTNNINLFCDIVTQRSGEHSCAIYKVYKYVSTSQSGNTATIVLADEAGKQYTITVVEGVPNGLTVKDENGNVVTDQFKWLMQGE